MPTCSVWRGVGGQLQDVLQAGHGSPALRLLHQDLLGRLRHRFYLTHHRPRPRLQLQTLPCDASWAPQ